MFETFKTRVEQTRWYVPLRYWWHWNPLEIQRRRWIENSEKRTWLAHGKPAPPPQSVKISVLRSYAEMYHLKVFVETGTHFGGTVDALKDSFNKVYSIELSTLLYEKARHRFRKDSPRVEIINGDSAEKLGGVLKDLHEPALFWLDAHYSGGTTAKGNDFTPILRELGLILNSEDFGHIILIDDARLFGRAPEYPTLPQLEEYVFSRRKELTITVDSDSIRIVPTKKATQPLK